MAQATTTSPYEAAARSHKVTLLVAALNELAVVGHANVPQLPRLWPEVIDAIPEALWADIADQAGVRPPSAETIVQVRDVFARRARQHEHIDPFVGLVGVGA